MIRFLPDIADTFLRVALAFTASFALAALLSVSGALAFTTPSSSAGPGQYGVSISSVMSLTVPIDAAAAEICVEGAAARYTDDGVTTPTSSVGIPLPAGTCFAYSGPLPAFKIIGSGATMDVSYYK